MDDKSIQDLLEQAGAEYNRGQYAQAIALWEQVLQHDPENQKAREGIRMAKLLVVNWESSQAGGEGEELSLEEGGVDPETRQKIEFGIKRVRELLGGGHHQEAAEGCQLLAELAPGMPEVGQLQEEIAHILEAQPFVDEHLGKARKLLAANRAAEAAGEARKVLSVEPANEEARAIVAQGAGGAAPEGAAPPASAFQSGEGQAPPSPFAGSAAADEMAASMDFEQMPGDGEGGGDAPAGETSGDEMPLEMGFDEGGEPAPEGGEIPRIIQEGRKLFEQKKYQEAIDTWSRIYAIDQSNEQVSDLIDQAKARLAEVGAQVEQAMYRAQDQMEAGNLTGAKKAFEEVLAIQPGNPEALRQIAAIEEKLQEGEGLDEALPMEEPPPQGAPSGGGEGEEPPEAPSVGLAREPAREPAPGEDAARPVKPPQAPVSAGLPKKRKPVQPVRPPSQAPRMILLGALAAVVVAGGAAGWWFLMGPGAEPPPPLAPPPGTSAAALPEKPEGGGDGGGDGGNAEAEIQEAGGGVAGAGTEQAAPPDPAEIRRRVSALMREGRILMQREEYAGAQARFAQVLSLEPDNFEAEDFRMKASSLLTEQQKFQRDLDSAMQAFREQEWGASLYRLYRLQLEREDMESLSRYIENANYNWGVQSLEAFQIADALQHFNDALEQDPDDRTIQQHMEVAERYQRRRRDSAFDAYVSKIPLRAIDHR